MRTPPPWAPRVDVPSRPCHAAGVTARRETLSIVGGVALDGSPCEPSIAGGIFVDVTPSGAERLALDRHLIVPGLIDLQVNGADGIDLTGDPDALWQVAAALPRFGVTSFLPTLVSPGRATVERALAALAAGPPGGFSGARPLGWHLEGPFLAPTRAGAHPLDRISAPSDAAIAGWSATAGVAMVTLAPELPGAAALIQALVRRGVVVAAGHTEVTAEGAHAAARAGVSAVTHLFNAMPSVHHRDPGLAGAVLDGLPVSTSLVADGAHLSAEALRTAWRLIAPQRRLLVSDAVAALGAPAGTYTLAGRTLISDGAVVRTEDGGLAGSATGLDACLRNTVTITQCEPCEAFAAVTANPAALLGRAGLGNLRPGSLGDLTVLDGDLQVVATVVAGAVVYRAG